MIKFKDLISYLPKHVIVHAYVEGNKHYVVDTDHLFSDFDFNLDDLNMCYPNLCLKSFDIQFDRLVVNLIEGK